MSLRIGITTCLLLSGLLFTGTMFATEQRGSVKVAGLPIPGANVTATLGDQKIVTSTDDSGIFVFPNLGPGDWIIEVDMPGFTGVSRSAAMSDDTTPPPLDLVMKVGKPIVMATAAAKPAIARTAEANPVAVDAPKTAEAKPAPAQTAANRPQRGTGAPGRAARGGAGQTGRPGAGGFQRLELQQTAQGSELQAALTAAEAPPQQDLAQNANESFLVNGSVSSGLTSPDRMDDSFGRMSEFRDGFGGPGGPGGPSGGDGGGRGGPGGGGFGGGPGGISGNGWP